MYELDEIEDEIQLIFGYQCNIHDDLRSKWTLHSVNKTPSILELDKVINLK